VKLTAPSWNWQDSSWFKYLRALNMFHLSNCNSHSLTVWESCCYLPVCFWHNTFHWWGMSLIITHWLFHCMYISVCTVILSPPYQRSKLNCGYWNNQLALIKDTQVIQSKNSKWFSLCLLLFDKHWWHSSRYMLLLIHGFNIQSLTDIQLSLFALIWKSLQAEFHRILFIR